MDTDWLRSLLSLSDEPAIVVSDGVITDANPAARELGLQPPYVITACIHPLPDSFAEQTVQRFKATVLGVPASIRALCKDGLSVFFLQPDSGTEFRRSSANEAALANVSGSLRNCLQELNLSIAALAEGLKPEEAGATSHAATALRCAYQLARTAGHMEDYYLLAAGNYRLNQRPADVSDLLHRLCQSAGDLLLYRGIQMTCRLPEHPVIGYVDGKLLELLFWELTSNAAAAASDGRLALEAAVGSKHDLLLTIQNRMPKGALPDRLFDRYSVPPEELLDRNGIGLGLTLASAAARLHGGKLLVSVDAEGIFTAAATIRLTGTPSQSLHNTTLVPASGLNYGLVALSTVLPISAYDPTDIMN